MQTSGVSGSLIYGISIRYFEDYNIPAGTWVALSNNTILAPENRNTGDVATTPGLNLWAQVALHSSGTTGGATIKVVKRHPELTP